MQLNSACNLQLFELYSAFTMSEWYSNYEVNWKPHLESCMVCKRQAQELLRGNDRLKSSIYPYNRHFFVLHWAEAWQPTPQKAGSMTWTLYFLHSSTQHTIFNPKFPFHPSLNWKTCLSRCLQFHVVVPSSVYIASAEFKWTLFWKQMDNPRSCNSLTFLFANKCHGATSTPETFQ